MQKWTGFILLAVTLGCTVGEAPPRGPSVPPGAEPAPEQPGAAADTAAEAAAGDDVLAAELLVRAQQAYAAAEVEESLDLALQVVSAYVGTPSAVPARWVAARSAFAVGRYAEARTQAEAYASAQPSGSDAAAAAEQLAALARDALDPPAQVPAVIGAVLPRSGSRILVQYADWLLEGMKLAVQQAEARQGRTIQLVVADDSGGVGTRAAVADLEQRGALAILGPMMPDQVAPAAGARFDRSLVILSPTATAPATPWPATYTINNGDARGAQLLGDYAARLGLAQAAVLYPREPEYERKAQAFAVDFEAGGGVVRAMVPYDSGTTTFGTHMERILEAVAPRAGLAGAAMDTLDGAPPVNPAGVGGAEPPVAGAPASDSAAAGPDPWHGLPPQQPFALFVAAPERDVPQIAPQVAFYGLDSAGVQVFGDEAWASAPVRRLVPAHDLEGVIAASHLPPGRADAVADPDFVHLYENTYRRSLPNQLPALGYDAANLLLQAMPNRMLTPDALARRFTLLAGIHGATGRLSVRANQVVRTPYLVVIHDGELEPAPSVWDYRMPVPKPPLPDTLEEAGR